MKGEMNPSVPGKVQRLVNNKIRTWVLLCMFGAIYALISAAAFGQELPAAKPEMVGMSAEPLERIGMAVQKSIDEKRIAGAVTLVARRGKAVWFKPQGMMDREASKAMPRHDFPDLLDDQADHERSGNDAVRRRPLSAG